MGLTGSPALAMVAVWPQGPAARAAERAVAALFRQKVVVAAQARRLWEVAARAALEQAALEQAVP